MAKNTVAPALEHYGLSVAQVLGLSGEVTRPAHADGSDMSIMMRNDVRFSMGADPSVAVAKGRLELIRVERRGNLLTIADIWGENSTADGGIVERFGARLYAVKSVPLQGATVYMFLPRLPAGLVDDKFFPANGTAVLFDGARKGPTVLKACGTDSNSGTCQGWIFDAIET
jgi:hypothetical protein